MTYYHTDHLGSSSWITYTDGSPVQYMSYMTFGESQVDQRAGDWNSRYTFSGKERDEETGYSYFGARYYDADLSIWLSRDPLAHLYSHQSPYVYCSNNPIKRIDPNGMADEVIITGDQDEEAFDQLKNSTNLNLTMDTDGKINAHIDLNSNLSANDIELYTAIKSSDITVSIDASSQVLDLLWEVHIQKTDLTENHMRQRQIM